MDHWSVLFLLKLQCIYIYICIYIYVYIYICMIISLYTYIIYIYIYRGSSSLPSLMTREGSSYSVLSPGNYFLQMDRNPMFFSASVLRQESYRHLSQDRRRRLVRCARLRLNHQMGIFDGIQLLGIMISLPSRALEMMVYLREIIHHPLLWPQDWGWWIVIIYPDNLVSLTKKDEISGLQKITHDHLAETGSGSRCSSRSPGGRKSDWPRSMSLSSLLCIPLSDWSLSQFFLQLYRQTVRLYGS